MISSRTGIVAASVLALALMGCQSQRFSQLDTRGPEPLTPAPSGNVQASQLPPPSDASSPNDFPAVPGANSENQVASLGNQPPAGAQEVTAGSVAGVWNVSVAGQSCRVATPQTKYGQGFRAGPLHCPAPMDGVKSWKVDGQQLAFYDQGGQTLARLYSSGDSRFDGQTTSGQPISLTR